MKISQGKVRGASDKDRPNKEGKIDYSRPVFPYSNPNQVDGEGYPHGVIWINGKNKKEADAMIINTGDRCYQFWIREKPQRIPRTSKYIEWKHVFDFHDYELEELAICSLERIPDEEYTIYKRVRAEL
jgi:hypothetical protein